MAETVNNTVADIQEVFANLGTTTCIRLLNIVHKRLIEEFRLYTTSVDFSTFDGSAREYAWNENHVAVWSAAWHQNSTAEPIPLDRTSVDQLDEDEDGWRNSIVSQPNRFYLYQKSDGAAVIGFDVIPSASSGGYPLVRCQVSVHADLSAGNSLPATLKNNLPYVSGVCEIWASRRGTPAQAAFWNAQHEKDKNELGVYVQRRQRRNPPTLTPAFTAGASAL